MPSSPAHGATTEMVNPPVMTAGDNRHGAARALAWVILLNKPFYPLYMLWLAPGAFGPAWLTAMSAPAYAAAIWLMGTKPLLGRLLIFGAGIADTVIAIKAFGSAAGAEWFYVPIMLLVPAMFGPHEKAVRRQLALATLAVILASLRGLGTPIALLTGDETTSLFWMNFYAVACLTLFILWRFQVVRLPAWR